MTRPRLAVDIGGTFTDVAVERGGSCLTSKVLTTPGDPVRGVLDGVRLALARAELAPPDIGAVVHGTTLATNALIERRGATVGAIVTEGFRDILGRAWRRSPAPDRRPSPVPHPFPHPGRPQGRAHHRALLRPQAPRR